MISQYGSGVLPVVGVDRRVWEAERLRQIEIGTLFVRHANERYGNSRAFKERRHILDAFQFVGEECCCISAMRSECCVVDID